MGGRNRRLCLVGVIAAVKTALFRLVNVVLQPTEFETLPLEVVPLLDDVVKADRDETDPRRPLPTAVCRVPLEPPFETEEKVGQAVYWLMTLLGFLTRRPCAADHMVILNEAGERVGWQALKPVSPSSRAGHPMFRTNEELRAVMDAGWPMWRENSVAIHRLHRAFDWHNIARNGTADTSIDISLLQHWIAIEVLAGAWAKGNDRDQLLTEEQVKTARDWLTATAQDWHLSKTAVQEVWQKAGELARRPAVSVLTEYVREVLSPFASVQPLGAELDLLVKTTIPWRNRVVHEGALRIEEIDGGAQQVALFLRQLDCLTERVLLANLGAKITYLASIPWTYIMVGA
jgi:hypothetical protein